MTRGEIHPEDNPFERRAAQEWSTAPTPTGYEGTPVEEFFNARDARLAQHFLDYMLSRGTFATAKKLPVVDIRPDTKLKTPQGLNLRGYFLGRVLYQRRERDTPPTPSSYGPSYDPFEETVEFKMGRTWGYLCTDGGLRLGTGQTFPIENHYLRFYLPPTRSTKTTVYPVGPYEQYHENGSPTYYQPTTYTRDEYDYAPATLQQVLEWHAQRAHRETIGKIAQIAQQAVEATMSQFALGQKEPLRSDD